MKNFNDPIGNQTRDLPTCTLVTAATTIDTLFIYLFIYECTLLVTDWFIACAWEVTNVVSKMLNYSHTPCIRLELTKYTELIRFEYLTCLPVYYEILKFSRQWKFMLWSSGLWHNVFRYALNCVKEEYAAYTLRNTQTKLYLLYITDLLHIVGLKTVRIVIWGRVLIQCAKYWTTQHQFLP
jgi:hypothetical protein